MEQITFNVPGMTCAHCERAVHDEVTDVRGVESVSVDLATKDVVVTGTDLVLADLAGGHRRSGLRGRPRVGVAHS